MGKVRRVERQLQGELFGVFKDLIKSKKLENIIDVILEEGRSDLLFVKANTGKPIFSLELKDPIAPDGRTVFHADTILRELARANKLGCDTFGISNFIEVAIFNTTCPSAPCEWILEKGKALDIKQIERYRETLKVTPEIRKGLEKIAEFVLDKILQIVQGNIPQLKPVDERFVYKLKSLIDVYVWDIAFSLQEEYKEDIYFKNKVNDWFRKQLWTIPSDEEDFYRIAHIALLMLVSKLIFYKALYDKGVYGNLPKLVIPETIKNAKQLKQYLFEEYFKPLMEITGDYENLIGEEDDILNEIPFLADAVVDFVKDIVHAEESYDFSKLPYDIAGKIFEELIREEERKKFGQYFTPTPVVDLINSFCVRTGHERVLDPTCGSGTFLVRLYERKKNLTGKRHDQLLDEIVGIDISTYAVELATLNLAIRDFRYKVYPKVYRKDFFKVFPKDIGTFDAIVGNPPYTRQEEIDDFIPDEKIAIYETLKKDYGKDFEPSKRSSLYAYVFYHSGVFLREGGYLGFITSNSYLDTDYGIDLQRWMLENFKIVAIIDSKVERFFVDADVNTCITILQKESDKEKRDRNVVKFVYLKKKLIDVINRFGDVDKLRDFIEETEEFYEDEFLRINPVLQKKLFDFTKWGVFLRAGRIYWKILEKTKWIKLKDVADVRRGFTTGDNKFFYLEDITDGFENQHLPAIRNITRDIESLEDIKSNGLRIVKNGYGEVWLIEEELLKPVVKSPREINSYVIKPENLRYRVLYFGMKEKFKNTDEYISFVINNFPYAWKYIRWGESEGINEKPTCAGRNPWWDLGEWEGADALWFMDYNQRFFIPFNPTKVLEDNRLYGIFLHQSLWIFLNSSISAYTFFVISRSNLGLGSAELKVYEVENFPIPENFNLSEEELSRLFNLLHDATPKSIFEELGTDNPENVDLSKVAHHRLEIDKAVLKSIGFDEKEIPRILKELYAELIDLVKSRLERAKSVEPQKKKERKTEVETYLSELEKIIEEEGLEIKETYTFIKILQALIREKITSDSKLMNRILKAFWKKHFGKPLNFKEISNIAQKNLFGGG